MSELVINAISVVIAYEEERAGWTSLYRAIVLETECICQDCRFWIRHEDNRCADTTVGRARRNRERLKGTRVSMSHMSKSRSKKLGFRSKELGWSIVGA